MTGSSTWQRHDPERIRNRMLNSEIQSQGSGPTSASSTSIKAIKALRSRGSCLLISVALASTALAQPQQAPPQEPGGFQRRGPGGPGGPGGFFGQETKLLEQFDNDGNDRLDFEERTAAREWLAKDRAERQSRRGFGRRGGPGRPPFGGRGDNQSPPEPGEQITPADVENYPHHPIFDPKILRTFFLEFENPEWEKELADFNNTDVEVPANLTVDGKTYPDVGVHFRGLSSFMMVPEGRKRSLNLSLDWIHKGQDIDSYNTFNLLNSHEDPSFLRTVLYHHIARQFIPSAKANFVRLVINGENWGIYVNSQQFDKDFIKDWFGTKKGSRWKVPGNPRGQGGFAYLGDDVELYKNTYAIKSNDDPDDWTAFVKMLKTLNETPADRLEAELTPLLNIDGALKFLALDITLINNDGFWTRASDYNIYRDTKGQFHVIPHDANETFAIPGGPGFGRRGPRPRGPNQGFGGRPERPGQNENPPRGPGNSTPPPPGERGPGNRENNAAPIEGVKLDPLHIANDPERPLASKLLAVPVLRTRYLGYVKQIAEQCLGWENLGPIAESYHALIADDIRRDTRKLESTEHFEHSLTESIPNEGGPGPRETIGLKKFADQRREYLLNHPEIKALK